MPEKILIVDDEPFNVDLLEQELEDQGFDTWSAASGQEALIALDSEQPNLVLLDWQMPGMSGIEVLQQMRAASQWQRLPIIMVTARGTTEDKVAGLNAGADDYLTKPIDEAELSARIRAMLRIARLENETSPCARRSRSGAIVSPTSSARVAPWSGYSSCWPR